ncbi:MAG: hypothetical protein HKN70_06155 [Gammaproteobacteria bacterium]|nr:hypothetical protein [Gammaproteobacteria bacterium]
MKISAPPRARHQQSFPVSGDADTVFALMCPVRECDWLESWSPGKVLTHSGLVEPECVFTSRDNNGESTWLVPDHDPVARRIRLVKFTPDFTVCLLTIDVESGGANNCTVSVCYSYTALSDKGVRFVNEFTESRYLEIMQHWQAAIQHYLDHGQPLPGS